MTAARKAASPKATSPKSLKVTAPLVQAFVGGRAVHFYWGDILPDGVSEESVNHLKSLGYVESVDAPESDEDN